MPPSQDPSNVPSSGFPGERLGLPEEGIGSVAGFGRRIAALVVDWGLAMLIGWLLFDYHPVAVSASFLVLTAIGIWLIGGSIGHTILGMRVNTLDGRAPGPWRPWVRQLLLAAVIPALVMDEDQRGMHELLSGTVLRRFR